MLPPSGEVSATPTIGDKKRGKWHEVPIGDKKHVILSASEISHRTIVILIIPSVIIPSLRGSVATKQTPGREAKNYVILNEVKNPTEELTGQRTARLFVREIFP